MSKLMLDPRVFKIHHLFDLNAAEDRFINESCSYGFESDYYSTLGVITIVSQRIGPQTYAYGLALCKPGDQFVKQTGIRLAWSRIHGDRLSYKGEIENHREVQQFTRIKRLMLIDLYTKKLPEWAFPIIEQHF